MRQRWTLGAAVLLMTLAAWGQSLATGAQSGRLEALAARRDLCDLVCYARAADGSISQANRIYILKEAKEVLSPDEYRSFKQALDRIAPPKPTAKRVAKATWKKPGSAQPALAKSELAKPALDKPEAELVIPTGAILPDRMAPQVFLR
jgi:hypothetical protein